MPEASLTDFQAILAHPTLVYEEGRRFFQGTGLMNETLKRLAHDLEQRGIAYAVIGAVALNQHGYHRFTQDIDLLMTKEGLSRFSSELVGRGYRPAFAGATKTFRSTAENVPIEIITSGEYPGDGKPKPVFFPDPLESSVQIEGINTLSLEKLVELKLASGMTGLGRLKDLADVQELIRIRGLEDRFSERLDPSVRETYQKLYTELIQAKAQELAPDYERRPEE